MDQANHESITIERLALDSISAQAEMRAADAFADVTAATDRWAEAVRRLADTPAASIDALRAKARAILEACGDCGRVEDDFGAVRSVLRDVLALA